MSDPNPPTSPGSATAAAPPQAKFEWSHSPFEAFLEQHFKKLLLLLGLAALGVGGWLVLQQRHEEQRTREGEAFAGAETLDDYKKVIANYPGTTAAGSAQFMIANLLAQNNDIAGAIEELEKFASTHEWSPVGESGGEARRGDKPTHPLVDQAAFRIAVLTIEKGDLKGGLDKLDSFIKRFPKSPLRPLAQLRRADGLAAAGERDKAAEMYQAILDDNALAGNAVRADAQNRLDKVKLKPPVEVEFVPEPPPAPPVATSPGIPPTVPGEAAPEIKVPSLGLDAPGPAEAPIIPESPVPAARPGVSPAPTPPPAPPVPEK